MLYGFVLQGKATRQQGVGHLDEEVGLGLHCVAVGSGQFVDIVREYEGLPYEETAWLDFLRCVQAVVFEKGLG
jgi:hypothetical protein